MDRIESREQTTITQTNNGVGNFQLQKHIKAEAYPITDNPTKPP